MKNEKQLLLDEIKGLMDRSSAFVLTRYQNMNPDLFYNFRLRLGEKGGDFEVVKKRVLVKAAQNGAISLNSKDLQGHVGVLFSFDDPIQSTKALIEFSKENNDAFEVLGGFFEGRLCSATDVKAIAELPSKDEMRAQFLGTLEAPMSQTLAVLEALLTSVPHCLDQNASKETNI